MTSHFYLSLELFAQTLRQARGTTVGGINETDGSLPSKRLEGMSERSAGGFEGKAFAPVAAGERPCDLPVGPAVRKVEAHAPDEHAGRPLFERPHPEASEVPVASEHRHLPPGIVPAENPPVSHVPHDVRVGAHGSVWLDVGIAKGAEQQTFGLEREHRPHHVP